MFFGFVTNTECFPPIICELNSNYAITCIWWCIWNVCLFVCVFLCVLQNLSLSFSFKNLKFMFWYISTVPCVQIYFLKIISAVRELHYWLSKALNLEYSLKANLKHFPELYDEMKWWLYIKSTFKICTIQRHLWNPT